MLQKQPIAEISRRQRRRRCHGDQRHRPARPVVVMREPRLELCHPDDFHALRDVDVSVAVDFDTEVPLVCPRYCSNVDGHRRLSSTLSLTPAVLVPFSCSCSTDCCDGGLGPHNDNLIPGDAIPLSVDYIADQEDDVNCDGDDDDDDDDGGGGGDSGDDNGCSDSTRHTPSKLLFPSSH